MGTVVSGGGLNGVGLGVEAVWVMMWCVAVGGRGLGNTMSDGNGCVWWGVVVVGGE